MLDENAEEGEKDSPDEDERAFEQSQIFWETFTVYCLLFNVSAQIFLFVAKVRYFAIHMQL